MKRSTLLMLVPILLVSGGVGALKLAAQRVIPSTFHMQVAATGLQFIITASPSTGVAGYNIWCGTAAGGPYATNVNPALINGLTYTWTTGVPGTKYFCVARAVDSLGQASANSPEANGTFPKPAPPLPPAGLAIQ